MTENENKPASASIGAATGSQGEKENAFTDNRELYEWRSKYPPDAQKHMWEEAWYLFALLSVSFAILFLNWRCWFGCLSNYSPLEIFELKKYIYYATAGLLGGTAFGIKYFYRTIARGRWHLDRRPWRVLSPFKGMTLAFAIGAFINAGFIAVDVAPSTATVVGTGFLVGYFADKASGKMAEIANVVFGTSSSSRPDSGS
jgi:hypothetical protein